MASSSDLREKLRKKRRALQQTLQVKDDVDTDTQELTAGEEEPGDTLRRNLKAQRQKRKKKLEEVSTDDTPDGSVVEPHDETVVEVTAVQQISHDDDKPEEPVIVSSPTHSQRGDLPPRPQATPAPSSSHSENSTMRQRMRDKLRAARSKAESLLQQEASLEVPASRLQSLRDRDTLTRFDRETEPDLRAGRDDHSSPLNTKVKFRETVRRVRMESMSETGLPTAEEAYNFFTFNFDPEPHEEAGKGCKKRRPKTKGENDDEEVEEEEEEEVTEVDREQKGENEERVKLA